MLRHNEEKLLLFPVVINVVVVAVVLWLWLLLLDVGLCLYGYFILGLLKED